MASLKQSVGHCSPSASGAESGKGRAAVVARQPCPELSLPMRAGDLPFRALVDLHMAHYAGRDSSRVQRLQWWSDRLGDVSLQEISDDEIHSALEGLASMPARVYMGKSFDGSPIYKSRGRTIAPGTVNRYLATIGAVLTWAVKRRIAPRGYVHPCRTIERRPENNGRTRFLSESERTRLLEACKTSSWDRLYLLVIFALTTGARRGELLALNWADIDLDNQVALCGRTKNGDPKSLPLVPAVIQALTALPGAKKGLVFPSARSPNRPFAFESVWKRTVARARLRDFRFHDLRHTCASMLAQSGATLLEIGDVLGHRQLQMTKRYSHLTTTHKAALVNRVLGDLA